MSEVWARVERFFKEELWRQDAWWVRLLQGGVMVVEGFVRDQLLLRAHSLTYITVLSLIPMMALGLGLAGMLGLRERVSQEIFERVGALAPDVARHMQSLVEGFDFGSLGAIGGAFLFLTTILAVGNVEVSFNHIWGVTKQRSWMRRIPDYLFVIMIAPVVMGLGLSLGTTLQSPAAVQFLLDIPFFEALWGYGLKQLPLVLFVLGFMFVYWFLPNTSVRIDSAAVGGLVAGLFFPVLLYGYVGFAVGAARMNAIFGGFAQLPLFLVFTYFTWALVLLGAEVSFAYQNVGRYRREVKGAIPGPAGREAIGLAIAVEVARRFERGAEPCTADELSDALDVRVRTVRDVLDALEAAGVLAERADDERSGGYQLARPAERIPIGRVVGAIRGEREPVTPSIDGVFEELEKRMGEITERRTLADLLRE